MFSVVSYRFWISAQWNWFLPKQSNTPYLMHLEECTPLRVYSPWESVHVSWWYCLKTQFMYLFLFFKPRSVTVCRVSLETYPSFSCWDCADPELDTELSGSKTGSRVGMWSRSGLWDLARPGIEPVSLALAGGFLTTGPPRSHVKISTIWIFQESNFMCKKNFTEV